MAKAYGSITIVDIGDLGQLSVVPESNQPLMVLYDPNTGKYNPNWGELNSNLILTPNIMYGDKNLVLGSLSAGQTLTVKWQKKIGSGTPIELSSESESMNNRGQLVVKKNPFEKDNISLITYLVTVSYTEPNMGTTLTAKGQMTFSLIQNASKVKQIRIIGNSVFLYKSNNEATYNSITLEAKVQNVDITAWKYKNSNGVFQTIPDSGTSTTLVVGKDADIFVNDVASIRVETNTPSVYDEHTITKIRDGANGDSVVSAVLSNEDQMIPCDSKGKPTSYEGAKTTLTIYEGNSKVTNKWTVDIVPINVTGSKSVNTEGDITYTVESITEGIGVESGEVTFNCTGPKKEKIVKKFSLVKIKTGADGESPTIYSLVTDSLAINAKVNEKGEIQSYEPAVLSFKAIQKKYDRVERKYKEEPYKGRFEILVDNGISKYTSSSGESEKKWTISGVKRKIVVKLFADGGTTNLYDTQTIVITSDGVKGETGSAGAAGKDSLNFVLGNQSDVLPCTNDGKLAQQTIVAIDFTAFKGINRVPCSATITNLPTEIIYSNVAGTASKSGLITLTFNKGLNLGPKDSGQINIQLSAQGQVFNTKYSWTKNKQALDGRSSIILEVYAPNGNIISNKENDVILEAKLIEGATTIEKPTSYTWAKYENGQYNSNLSNNTSKTYTVSKNDVNGYASYQCEVVYGEKSYYGYFSVYDKTDPVQVEVRCTLGSTLVNSQGQGIVYAYVTRNLQDIDPMPTLKCVTTLPGSSSKGDKVWLLNKELHSVTLYEYDGSAWQKKSIPSKPRYEWHLRNDNNETQEQILTGKAIYIDADVVNKKMTFDVTVEL